ncbi:MAG: response regulator [Planctomycetes bacterium]|nr:response regulator [Planctomycetota bacterium]
MSRLYSILLVEDDQTLRASLVEILASRGLHVFAAGRGSEAVELARSLPLDFSILDMHLPEMTGLEVLRRIAREVRPLPSIMMSGNATSEEAQAALSAGAFTFLRKPLELNQFMASVESLILHHFGRPPGMLPAPPR